MPVHRQLAAALVQEEAETRPGWYTRDANGARENQVVAGMQSYRGGPERLVACNRATSFTNRRLPVQRATTRISRAQLYCT